MKISEKSIELLQLIYDNTVPSPRCRELEMFDEPQDVAESLQISENDIIKCLLYLEDKHYIEILNRNKYNRYRITSCGIDKIELS